MKGTVTLFAVVAALSLLAPSLSGADNPYVGHWALTIPGGGAGWLGVSEEGGQLKAAVLWGGGSVVPTTKCEVVDGVLIVTRVRDAKKKVDGKDVKIKLKNLIRATRDGDKLALTVSQERPDETFSDEQKFTGKRNPPLPPKPNLAQVKYGKPVVLFDGKNLEAWTLLHPSERTLNGWSVKDGLMVNDTSKKEGGKHFGNLRTVAEFEDFTLTLEVNVPKGGNSGVYLRGIYEIQVSDSYGKALDAHNMGGLYSRIKPTVAAEKPTGQWQTMELTLCDRHVTVKLNGVTIIDNQPALGCTGGALTSDEFKAGPLYLQGDHTAMTYRNIVLRPIVK